MAIVNRIRGKAHGKNQAHIQTHEIGTGKGTEETQDAEKFTATVDTGNRSHRVRNENARADKKGRNKRGRKKKKNVRMPCHGYKGIFAIKENVAVVRNSENAEEHDKIAGEGYGLTLKGT